jgi:hypothetical protein
MFSSETNLAAIGPNSGGPLSQPASSHAALSQAKLDSFHGALSDAVSSTLEKFGIHPNDVKISITPARTVSTPVSIKSGNPVGIAPSAPGTTSSSSTAGSSSSSSGSASSAGSSSTSSTSSGAPNGGYDPFLQAAYSNPYQGAPLQSSTQSVAQTNTAPLDAQQVFDDSYWASQPAPVQALRTMQDPEQRTALATQLANEGYSIDVPIMVWGWDPSVVTSMRQADGYTWVPSALQSGVEVAPGLPSTGSLAAYNPNNPPAGSIAV